VRNFSIIQFGFRSFTGTLPEGLLSGVYGGQREDAGGAAEWVQGEDEEVGKWRHGLRNVNALSKFLSCGFTSDEAA
jgi:hypothetical protein